VPINAREGASTKRSFLASSALRRWGGAGAALGGALLAVWGYLHGNMGGSAGPVVAAAMGLLIDTLLLVGLAGLCAWWWEGRTDLLGAVGFVLVFVGVALSVAHGIHGFVTASGIAELAPWWVYVRAASGLPAYVASWLPVLPVGMVAVGIGSVRSGALGGWGVLPLAMGLLGAAYHLTDSGGLFGIDFAHVPFGAAYSLGWVLLGCLLWRQGTATHAHAPRR
jgi:hypothetical protein